MRGFLESGRVKDVASTRPSNQVYICGYKLEGFHHRLSEWIQPELMDYHRLFGKLHRYMILTAMHLSSGPLILS